MSAVAIVQYDTREACKDGELVKENTQFCEASGYDHLFILGSLEELPPYWGKVLAVREVARSGRYDYVLFLDTDAVVMDHSLRVESLFEDDSCFVAGGPDGVNAGVYAIKCDDDGLAILEDWASRYKPSEWSFHPQEKTAKHQWKTTAGVWAGPGYEQHSLNEFVIPNHRSKVRNVGPDVFLHCDSIRTSQSAFNCFDFQVFVSAMRTAKIVHFCCNFGVLSCLRHKARAGEVVLFDAHQADTEAARKEGVRICLGEPPPR